MLIKNSIKLAKMTKLPDEPLLLILTPEKIKYISLLTLDIVSIRLLF